jgi:DNA modification methylase
VKPYHSDNGATLYHGDCLAVLAALPENSVDTVITDPPYHLTTGKNGGTGAASLNPNSPAGRSRIGTGFMGKAWDGGDVAFRPETWAAVLRVAKPGAMLLAFGGSRTFHRLTCAIEDGGWEIRDCLSWLYGSGFPKSLDISKAMDKAAGVRREVVGTSPNWRESKRDYSADAWEVRGENAGKVTAPATATAQLWNGWGTALKPAWEPIILAMKPLDGTFAENAMVHGVAGLNIDGGRIAGEVPQTTQGKSVSKYGGGKGFAPDGFQESNPSPLGRWPANVLLDEAAAKLLDEQSGELTSGKLNRTESRQRQSGFAMTSGEWAGDTGGASRFFYTAKASKSDRGHGNDHPTVKPTELMKYLCTLTTTPTGGIVLDPFAGSGTTLVAARECGRPSIGIELEAAHCAIIVKRLAQGVLFAPEGEVA